MTNSMHSKDVAKGQDLGPLAWVLGEMRQTYDQAMERLQAFASGVADKSLRPEELSEQAADLVQAKSLVHQACGALEMVGAFIPAFVLRQSEHAVARMVQRPHLCTPEAVQALSQSGLALGEYLENLLVNPRLSPVLLFPTYRKVHALLGVSPPASPADLWHLEGDLHEPELDMPLKAIAPGERARQVLDRSILNVMKGHNQARSARDLVKLCLGLSLANQAFRERTFWKVAAGFFEALSLQKLPNDVYVKRAATRVLVQYATLTEGDALVTARWMQDLLFFCGQARDVDQSTAPVLYAVREAFGLQEMEPVDYNHTVFSLIAPAQKQAMRQALKETTDGWNAVMEGHIEQIDQVARQLGEFAALIGTHMAAAKPLMETMEGLVERVKQTQQVPTAELAMELATTILYFQALLEDVRIRSDKMPERMQELTQRLRDVAEKGHAQPLPVWVEELYTRVSDGETIGSVVSELKANLSEAESHLDRFFRYPTDTAALEDVPGILGRARGVLAVLGLVPATKAIQQINSDIRELIDQSQQENGEALALSDARFEKIGSNIGALSLQVDMLASQPSLSKELFVFDANTGRLQPLMGRLKVYEIGGRDIFEHVQESSRVTGPVELDESFLPGAASERSAAAQQAPTQQSGALPSAEASSNPVSADQASDAAMQPSPAQAASQPTAASADDESDDELLEIFLEEASQVIADGRQSLALLEGDPVSVPQQTILRRAFHTLKGSSRMVGLEEFGAAAWAMEQLMNGWLAEQKSFSSSMHQLCAESLGQLEQWVHDIEARQSTAHWSAEPFEHAALLMRTESRYVPLAPAAMQQEIDAAAVDTSVPEVEAAASAFGDEAEWDLDTRAIDLSMDWPEPLAEQRGAGVAATNAAQAQTQSTSEKLSEAIRSLDGLDLPDLDLDFQTMQERSALPSTPVPLDAADSVEELEAEAPAIAALLDVDAPEVDAGDAEDPAEEWILETVPAQLPGMGALEQEATPTAARLLVDAQSLDDIASLSAPAATSFFGDLSAPAALPETPATASDPALDGQEPEGSEAMSALLTSLENSLSRTEEDAVRWGVSFKETELANGMEAVQERVAPPPSIALSSHAQLLADLEALSAPTGEPSAAAPLNEELAVPVDPIGAAEPADEPALPVEEAAAVAASVESDGTLEPASADGLSGELAATAPQQDEAAQQAAAQIAQDLIGVGQKDETYWLLQILQATQDLEELLANWHTPGQAELLSQDIVAQARGLVTAGGNLAVAPSFVQYLEQIAAVVDFFASHQASDVPQVFAALTHGLQTVQTAMDAIVAGIGNGTVDSAEFSALRQLLAQALRSDSDAATVDFGQPLQAPAPQSHEPEPFAAMQDLVDRDLFPIFEEEALDLMPQLVGALRRWLSEPSSFEARSESLRVLHTLKGSSRLAGARQIGEMAHRFESEIEAIEAKDDSVAAVGQLLTRYDELQAVFDGLRGAVNAQELHQRAKESAEVALVTRSQERVRGDAQATAAQALRSNALSLEAVQTSAAAGYVPELGEPFGSELPGPTPLLIQASSKRQQTVRVRSVHINRLINQAGEIQISRSRAESRLRQLNTALDGMTVDLDRLRQQLRELEVQSESQMQSRMALGKDSANFDPLELDRFTRVQELTRMMAETVNDVATVQRTLQAAMAGTEDDLIAQERKGRELQRDLLHTRMVEFDSIAERLHSVVRQASTETGKRVNLVIENGRIEMDRVLLDRMLGGFEHILRNCVSHGIEPSATRESRGKPAAGTITLTVNHEGNDVSISFKDDGAGLDLEAIRRKGIERGLLVPGQVLSDKELSNLIFMPGFTTAHELTGISGRGIGMDVVRVDVSALGGRIETQTEQGKGTTFRLIMPLTTAVTQVMLVRSGRLIVGIPANLVDGIERVSQDGLKLGYQNGQLDVGSLRVPLYWSGALLQHSPRSGEDSGKAAPVVLVRSAAQVVAIHVDEVLGNQEVVVKNLGAQLSALPGLAGMSVLASGAVLLVYNFIALSSVYGEQAQALQRQDKSDHSALVDAGLLTEPSAEQAIPLILVVNDSITVRRVTQRLLKREGYRVALAAHGAQALEMLEQETPAVMLSDIEMPQMDGFELLRQVRDDRRYAQLPVIMITSRTAQKHRDHAMQLGANHYLGKPYSDAELLELVHEYAHAPQSQEAKVH
ncbi:response regulator [Lampropedia aestuarii]|uniref:response regulator n=1 Tax=Lampropedia aestuarii TaxID=2562762 RepID=UPI002468E92D|nr:response regulator [Lampropedia aestuarii]MDH5857995.1 response regulator [Lampropedia aestuarii]